MPEFYHVSRADISSVKQFDLYHCSGYIENKTLNTAEEFKLYKTGLFPDGIARHGEMYLHNVFKSSGPNMAFTENEYFLESIF